MAYIIGDNIITPLGDSSMQNYLAVEAGKVSRGRINLPFAERVLLSVRKALEGVSIDPGRTVFILSSTKGDMTSGCPLSDSARHIAEQIGLTTQAIVVSNACISGLAAIIIGNRLIATGRYEYAIVSGTDDIGEFITSGFQSLNAISAELCRPFDMERKGLNLGEALATVILSARQGKWEVVDGYIRNDAYNLTAPSKTAEGQYRCLARLIDKNGSPDFINTHGTATLFNDQMESVAITRAMLSNVPANALKGYFGHTLGAAGILETVISMKSAEENLLLATKGFLQLGVSGEVNLSSSHRTVKASSFIKMLSGFGGCNAAAYFRRSDPRIPIAPAPHVSIERKHRIVLSHDKCHEDGITLSALYKQHVRDYPKFYKMDNLCKLGFIASELLLKETGEERFIERDDRAIVLFNRSSSVDVDKKYMKTIQDKENYFPSPALFIYTLPNIVTGEIAIRNKWHGETSLYILSMHDEQQERDILEATCLDSTINSILAGWIDYQDNDDYVADLSIYEVKH